MSESRWNLLERLFAELAGADVDTRARRLGEVGAEDPTLRTELEALLRAADAPANPLDTPPVIELQQAEAALGGGPFQAGSRVGPYVLERLIGEGGMGWVWLAERTDGTLKRKVALKLPKWTWALPDLTERLAQERDILASLEHANIARLYDAGMDAMGRPYLAMEYVEGQPIDAYCRDRDLSVEDRLQLVRQVAGAVSYAHSRLVVHRDLKPSNIVVAADGSVRLLDFGIAKLLENDGTTGRMATAQGTRVFTLHYAAPEQITGGTIGTTTDVYALALVTYELLAGASPYRSPRAGAAALEEAILAGNTRLASTAATEGTVARRLRGDLDAILNKALKRAPSERYASIDAFADDIERHLKHETVSAQPDSAAYRFRTFARRHRTGLAAAAMVGLTLAGATVYSVRQAREADNQRARAVRSLATAEAVVEFYHFLLADAGPPDAPLTISAMIERSRGLLDTEFAGQPELEAAVLVVQASYYLGQGDAARGEPLAMRAVTLAADSNDSDLVGGAKCAHGYALALSGKEEEGARLIEVALGDTSLSPGTASACHAQRVYIAQNTGDGAAAERHARAAGEALRRDSRRRRRSEALNAADLGYALQLLGRIGEANVSFAAAVDQLTALKLEWTPVTATILNNWGIAVLYAGDVKRALELWERGADIARRRDPNAPLPSYLLGNLGRANEQMGRFAQALRVYEQTVAAARAEKRLGMLPYGLNGLSTVYLQMGDLERAEKYLAETTAVTDTLAPGAPQRLNADVLAARIALARGRTQEAWHAFERLRGIYDGQPAGPGAPGTRVFMADAALALQRPDDAARVAEEALALGRNLQSGMPHSRIVGLAHFALARAHAARGRGADARRESDLALDQFTNAVATDHPTVAEIRKLQASLPVANAR
jgi:eukaryotic-like serine/threonine-protein kinase